MDKKYQIFISSTFADLKDERQSAMNAVITLRHIPIGMEGFPAIDQEQMTYIKRLVDECDYYVLLIANRYGSHDESGVSFTEQEYRYAVSKGKHVLVFINNDGDITKCDNAPALQAFKQSAATGRIIKYFTDRSSLELAVSRSLAEAFEADPRVGWVRGDAAVDPRVLTELEAARSKIAELNSRLTTLSPPPQLADLGQKISIAYGYKYPIGNKDFPRSGILDATLRDIFLAIGHDYRNWKTTVHFNTPIKDRFPVERRSFSIPEDQIIKILNHFELLGLMGSASMASTSGSHHVYYRLTDAGEELLKKSLAISPVNLPA